MCTEIDEIKKAINDNMNTYDQENISSKNEDIFLQIKKDFLKEHPGNEQKFIEYTESPELCIALIEKVRNKDNINEIIFPISSNISFLKEFSEEKDINDELANFTIRHYTNHNPQKFNGKVKSNLTLTAETGVPLTRTTGHTTGLDWNQFGNVGDTFYSLFYKGELASKAKTPAFINDAHFYIEWTLDEFGECWASGDWLDYIINKPKEPATLPHPPLSYSGSAREIVLASMISENDLALKFLDKPNSKTDEELKKQIKNILENGVPKTIDKEDSPQPHLKMASNFEVKKHGSMEFNSYYAKDDSGIWHQL